MYGCFESVTDSRTTKPFSPNSLVCFESAHTYNFFWTCHWQDHIQNIRDNYTKDFRSKDETKRQIAVATYLIDKLALRAGNEKVLSYWNLFSAAMSDALFILQCNNVFSDVPVGNLVSDT